MIAKTPYNQEDVPRRKRTPTDGFNIQRMNSEIFHTSAPDVSNKIEMLTRQTPHGLPFAKSNNAVGLEQSTEAHDMKK